MASRQRVIAADAAARAEVFNRVLEWTGPGCASEEARERAMLLLLEAERHIDASRVALHMYIELLAGRLSPAACDPGGLMENVWWPLELSLVRSGIIGCVTALDLCAAAFGRLAQPPIDEKEKRTPGQEWDVSSLNKKKDWIDSAFAGWLIDTRGDNAWAELQWVRRGFAHRWVRRDVTIGAAKASVVSTGSNKKRPLDDLLRRSTDFSAKRVVVAWDALDVAAP